MKRSKKLPVRPLRSGSPDRGKRNELRRRKSGLSFHHGDKGRQGCCDRAKTPCSSPGLMHSGTLPCKDTPLLLLPELTCFLLWGWGGWHRHPPGPAHPSAQRGDKAPVSEPSPGPERCWGEGTDLHKEQEEDEDIRSALGEKEGRTKRS